MSSEVPPSIRQQSEKPRPGKLRGLPTVSGQANWQTDRSLSLDDLTALAFVVIAFVIFSSFPLAPAGVWSNLKYGEWIVQHGYLPEREPFSDLSNPNHSLSHLSWLPQVIFYFVYKTGAIFSAGEEWQSLAGGVEMLRSFRGLLIAFKISFIMLAIWRSTRAPLLAILGATLLVVLTGLETATERPQLFGEVLFCFLLWWQTGRHTSPWAWIVLPLVFGLWVNCDDSFLVGYAFVVLLAVGRVAERVSCRGAQGLRQPLRRGAVAGVLAAGAGLLNPHGYEIFAIAWRRNWQPNLASQREWLPMDFNQGAWQPWVYFGSLLAIALSQSLSRRPLPVSRLPVLIFFALAPLFEERLLVWWILLVPFHLAELWRDVISLPVRWRLFCSHRTFRNTVVGGIVVLGAFAWRAGAQVVAVTGASPLARSTADTTPWPLVMQIKTGRGLSRLEEALDNYPERSFQGRLFAQADLADFMIWSLPKAPVLVYSAPECFPQPVWQNYRSVLSGEPGWKAILARYEVNMVVIDSQRHTALAGALREDKSWLVVPSERDGPLLIAVRRRPLPVRGAGDES